MAAKKDEIEERIPPDEKKRTEEKALEGGKVDRPVDEKLEEKTEKIEEEAVEGMTDPKEVEKEIKQKVEKEVEEKAEEGEAKEEKPKEEAEKKEESKEGKVIKGTTPVVREVQHMPESLEYWKPKTALGKEVFSRKITDINQILESGRKIMEPEIVDMLVPDLRNELILIGGRKGKGGGKQRIAVRITATMNRSGRKFKANAFAIVGDGRGLIGVGKASAIESRDAIQKAISKAKMNVVRIKRGCGSWECGCGEDHSIPYNTEGKSGSVRVVLMPAPRGLGLAADDESKKLLSLVGIKDVWVKTYGSTGTRINLIKALFNALKNLYIYDR
jgi:small subunit ribosomal protein S5